jgi:hypothetical protein
MKGDAMTSLRLIAVGVVAAIGAGLILAGAAARGQKNRRRGSNGERRPR